MILKKFSVDNGFLCQFVFSENECVQLLKAFDDGVDGPGNVVVDDEGRQYFSAVRELRALYAQSDSIDGFEIELPRNSLVVFQKVVLEAMRGLGCDCNEYSTDQEYPFADYRKLLLGMSQVLDESFQRVARLNRKSRHLV